MDAAARNPYLGAVLDDLYNTDILGLAGSLQAARLSAPDGTARRTAKLCGSELEIDVEMDGERVADVALRVRACALGQASAAVLERGIVGATLEDIETARDALRAMLKDGAAAPTGRFAELAALSGVAGYPARHQSVMLAWEAAVDAVRAATGESDGTGDETVDDGRGGAGAAGGMR